MKAGNDQLLRVVADGLINRAECCPRSCEGGRLLRDAAAMILDADMVFERARRGYAPAANDATGTPLAANDAPTPPLNGDRAA